MPLNAKRVADIAPNLFAIDPDVPHLGVEIEVENVQRAPITRGTSWAVVSDGSLRGPSAEFVFARPLPMDESVDQFRVFYRWHADRGYTTSIRTSTHVHVNVLGHTFEKILAALVTYVLMEPYLFWLCGPEREENIYCIPWYRSRTEVDVACALRDGDYHRVASRACKYSALYLEPMVRFGTLEFRHAPVWDHAQELTDWANICKGIAYCPFDTPDEALARYREVGARAFVTDVIGPELATILLSGCDVEELAEDADVETTAELLCCTYNEKPLTWRRPSLNVPGEVVGYARRALGGPGGQPMGLTDRLFEMDEYPDGEEEEDYPEYYDYDDEEVT